jgi:hypothetical protein
MERVSFGNGVWKSVSGRIVQVDYLDERLMHIVLEQKPDDESSRASLLADTRRLRGAIGKAVYAEGACTLEVGAYLTVTWTGYDGSAKDYSAEYAHPPRVIEVDIDMNTSFGKRRSRGRTGSATEEVHDRG